MSTPGCSTGAPKDKSVPNGCPSTFLRLLSSGPASGSDGEVAQLAEHATENRGVGSSILPLATIVDLRRQGSCEASDCTRVTTSVTTGTDIGSPVATSKSGGVTNTPEQGETNRPRRLGRVPRLKPPQLFAYLSQWDGREPPAGSSCRATPARTRRASASRGACRAVVSIPGMADARYTRVTQP